MIGEVVDLGKGRLERNGKEHMSKRKLASVS